MTDEPTYDFSRYPQYRHVVTRFNPNQNAYGIIRDVSEDLGEQLQGEIGRAEAQQLTKQFREACFERGSFEELLAFVDYSFEVLS